MRYYACESMYNIAKVAKGEILVYFNEVFDALCKVRKVMLKTPVPLKLEAACGRFGTISEEWCRTA